MLPWPERAHGIQEDRTETASTSGITCQQFVDLARFIKRLCRTGSLIYTDEQERNGKKGKRILWSEITMFEVCNNVIKPIIMHLNSKCSWSTLVNDRDVKPEIFISHSWQQNFHHFVSNFEHLRNNRGLTATSRIWICTFANNQFKLQLGQRLSQSPFYGALKHCREVALFLDHKASALNRSWCNFELSICIDTEGLRKFWKEIKCIAEAQTEEPRKGLREIAFDEFEKYKFAENFRMDKHPLLFITPAGLVGTARVTSGRVLKALKSLKASEAGAFDPVDRRRIMNHIAYNFLVEDENYEPEMEMQGLTERKDENGNFVTDLAEKGTASLDDIDFLESEYDYEKCLATGVTAEQFKMFDASVNIICQKELNRYIPRLSSSDSPVRKKEDKDKKLAWEESALSLSQLRDLEIMLHKKCRESNTYIWEKCTSHNLKDLDVSFMQEGETYAESVNEFPVKPNYYLIVPWDMPLPDVFKAIEWHAEALELSDRVTYFIHPFCIGISDRHGGTESVIKITTDGAVLILDQKLSQKWSSGKMSLWICYELFLVEREKIRLDFSCKSGVIAITCPFPNRTWVKGTFDPVIAEDITFMKVDCQNAQCQYKKDKDYILGKIENFNQFNKKLISLNISMIPTIIRHAACLDDGEKSLTSLQKVLNKLQEFRSQYFVEIYTRRGAFGETPLHIMAARSNVNKNLEHKFRAMMLALIDTGYDVNAQDDEGETPLHWAAFAGTLWTTKFLLRNGSNPMIPSYNGERPIDIAKEKPTDFLAVDKDKKEEKKWDQIINILKAAMVLWNDDE